MTFSRTHQPPIQQEGGSGAVAGHTASSPGGDGDGAIRLWGVPNGVALATLAGHQLTVTSLAFSADGLILVRGGADGDVRLWDAHEGRELIALSDHHAAVQRVAISPDGLTLASAGNDKIVRLWESALARLCRRPVIQTTLADLDWAETAHHDIVVTALERRWPALLLGLMRWRQQPSRSASLIVRSMGERHEL